MKINCKEAQIMVLTPKQMGKQHKFEWETKKNEIKREKSNYSQWKNRNENNEKKAPTEIKLFTFFCVV